VNFSVRPFYCFKFHPLAPTNQQAKFNRRRQINERKDLIIYKRYLIIHW